MTELTGIDPKGRFHPSLQWEPAAGAVAVGDLFDGQAFSRPLESLTDIATRKREALEVGRKASEQAGITYNGIRYAGDPSNRQALMEALDLADTTGQTTFASWKDSDGLFHADHPVADVRQALLDIATRRGQLIVHEGELNAQIDTALVAEDRTALEAVEWSEA
ncbi:DUF4376 domain-containing protein [Halomonas sp.]|uniref:DUF4376 domain-containing protein n=1 Tax=Halomonas sp. TaxID=1486246 RepID=UPI00257F34EE|nr:DUF4376 domain-containing protein [Halomonas sp.]